MREVRLLPGTVTLDDQHRYWLDDMGGSVGPFPSVTKLINPKGSRFIRREYAERGTEIHRQTEILDRGLDIYVSSEYSFYLSAWGMARDSLLDDGFILEDIEVQFVAAVGPFVYGGTADRLLRKDGRRGVLDIKTGRPEPWHMIQLAMYAIPLGASYGVDAYIKKDGKYELRWFEDLEGAFWSAVNSLEMGVPL